MQRQWRESRINRRLEGERSSTQYQRKLSELYAQVRQAAPQSFPYDYGKFQQLNAAYAKGETAFITTLGPQVAANDAAGQARLHADFEQFERRELAEKWWANDPVAVLVRHHAESDLDFLAGTIGKRVEDLVTLILGLPAQLATVLLLSFFITVDFPSLRAGVRSLQQSRLRFLFDDLFPGLVQLGNLIGKAFLAQGIVSLIDATLIYVALVLLGVENPLLLSVVVFVFSFVPVVGVILSAIPIVAMAIVQSNGSLALGALGPGGRAIGPLDRGHRSQPADRGQDAPPASGAGNRGSGDRPRDVRHLGIVAGLSGDRLSDLSLAGTWACRSDREPRVCTLVISP